MQEAKYQAFISYSHVDKTTARWLHRKLDGYRPPKFVGDPTNHAANASAPWRVFRDDEELGASADLKGQIKDALANSEALVVICSPACAASKYVNDEIRLFKALRGSGKRVFAVIAAGIPHHPEHEAFPQALKYAVDAQGNITEEREEPVAADLTKFDRQTVFLKVVAGLLDIAYGDLVNREQARRLRRIVWTTCVTAAVMIAVTITAAIAFLQAREAKRNLADSYVERGQRAQTAGDIFEAQHWFASASTLSDTVASRAGLVGTLGSPITFQTSWRAEAGPDLEKKGITSLAFVGEQYVAAGDKRGTAYLIDIARGTTLWSVSLGAQINGISRGTKQEEIVVGLEDGRLVWLDTATGKTLTTGSAGHQILSIRHDRKGTKFLAGLQGGVAVFDDGGKKLWDLMHGHAGSVQGLAFNAAGDHVYWGGSGSYIWACRVGADCQRTTRVEEWVYGIDISPDTRFIAYSAGGTVQVMDQAMQRQEVLSESSPHVFSVRFDRMGQYSALGSSDGSLAVYDIRSRKRLVRTVAHPADIYAVEFSPSGRHLASASVDGLVTIWNVKRTGFAVPPHDFRPTAPMLAAPQRNRISEIRVVADNAAWISTWDQRDRRINLNPEVPDQPELGREELRKRLLESMALAKVASFRLQQLSPTALWRKDGQELPKELTELIEGDGREKTITAISRSGKLLAAVPTAEKAWVFDNSGRHFPPLDIGSKAAAAVALLEAEKLLVVSSGNGEVAAYDLQNGQLRFQAACGTNAVQFLIAEDVHRRLFVAARSGPLCALDASGRLVAPAADVMVDALALSPDGQMLAVASPTGTVTLYDSRAMTELARFDGHRGPVEAVHFTLDSKRLVSGGADEIVRIWPADDARRIAITGGKTLTSNKASKPVTAISRAAWIQQYQASLPK